MPKPIIVVTSHGGNSPNRMMHKQISKLMDASICFFAKFERLDDNNEPLYSISLLNSNTRDKPLNQEQLLISSNIAMFIKARSRVIDVVDNVITDNTDISNNTMLNAHLMPLESIVDAVFKISRKLNFAITGNRFYNCFSSNSSAKMYLFPDVNLVRIGQDLISEPFHKAVHMFARAFYNIFSELAKFYVYGYSQSEEAVAKANRYFAGDEVDGIQLAVNLEHAHAANRLNIKDSISYINYEEIDDYGCTDVLNSCSVNCLSFFSRGRSSSVNPENLNAFDPGIIQQNEIDFDKRDGSSRNAEHITNGLLDNPDSLDVTAGF